MQQHTQGQQQVVGGLKRTYCSCQICQQNCRVIPGYLVPDDLNEIYTFMNPVVKFIDFVKRYFLASPGAIVMKGGKVFRIPTIVPARNPTNSYCIFYGKGGNCSIHKVAPFGCRYFDHSQTMDEADEISAFGLYQIAGNKLYMDVWDNLDSNNLRAIPPETLRQCYVKDVEANYHWKE